AGPGPLFTTWIVYVMFWPGETFVTVVEALIARSARSTVTAKPQEEDFPEASVALHATVVVPAGKIDPEGGLHETEAEQLSLTVGAAYVTGTPAAEVPGRVMSPGQAIIGGSMSSTDTVN